MSLKPHATEEEYFAREQALKRENLAKEEAERKAQEEREALKKLHWMHCPKCGQLLTPTTAPFSHLQVDRCESCHGLWFDKGEVELLRKKIVAGSKTAASSFLSLFKFAAPAKDGEAAPASPKSPGRPRGGPGKGEDARDDGADNKKR